MTYTTGCTSLPICAVHWINFIIDKDSVNCSIGRIPQHWWHNVTPNTDKILNNKEFMCFDDFQPSRYALSFIPQPNKLASFINVAFIALDSDKLGEHSEDTVHHVDFGDNKFPQFLENKKTKHFINNSEETDEDDDNLDSNSYLSVEQIANLSKYVPKSIVSFLTA